MSFPSDVCTNIETRCTGWLWWRSCHDECTEWKSRWDEVKDGIGDYVSSVGLAGGTEGAFAVSPQWDVNYGNCTRVCILSWCTNDCTTRSSPALSCDDARYASQTSGWGTFTSWSAPFMASLRAYSMPAPVDGNPGQKALQNATDRAAAFLANHHEYTAVVNFIVDDYPYGCGEYPYADFFPAYHAFLDDPRVSTNVITVGRLDNYWIFPWGTGGVVALVDASADVRGGMVKALDYTRRMSDKRQFLIPVPATGEPIDLDTFRFFLTADGSSYELPRWDDRWCLFNGDSMQGYWIDYPDGPQGRLRVNLCQATERWARQTRPTGYATYDCITEHDPEATFVRTGDFDLTKCNAAMMKPRALRFAWRTEMPWDSYIGFRLQFASRREDLDAAPANEFWATPWNGNAISWADLTNPVLGFGYNYQWARATATLYSSSDEHHTWAPSIQSWDLKFTCVDGF
jgi:hypothetical protein